MSVRKAWADYSSGDEDSDQEGFFAKYEPSAPQRGDAVENAGNRAANQRQGVPPAVPTHKTIGLAQAKRQLQVRDSQDSYSYQRKTDCLEADVELEGRLNGTALNFEGIEEKFERGERLENKDAFVEQMKERSKSSCSSSSTKVPGEKQKDKEKQNDNKPSRSADDGRSGGGAKNTNRGASSSKSGAPTTTGGGKHGTKDKGRVGAADGTRARASGSGSASKGGKNGRGPGAAGKGAGKRSSFPGGPGPGRIPARASGPGPAEESEMSPGRLMERISNSTWKGWGAAVGDDKNANDNENENDDVNETDNVNANDAMDLRESLANAPETKTRVKLGKVDFNKGKTIAIGHSAYEKPVKERAGAAAAGGRKDREEGPGSRPADGESLTAEKGAGATSKGGNAKGSKGKGKGKGAVEKDDESRDVEMVDEREESPEPRKFEERAAPTNWAAALNKTLTDADKAKSKAFQTKVPKFESNLNPHAPAYVPGFGALGTQVTMVQNGNLSQAVPFFGAALLAKTTSVPSSATSIPPPNQSTTATNATLATMTTAAANMGGIKRTRDVALTPASSARAGYFDKILRTAESGMNTPNSEAMGSEMTGISQVTTDSTMIAAPYIVGMVGQVYVERATSSSGTNGGGGGRKSASASAFAPAQRKKLNLAAVDRGTGNGGGDKMEDVGEGVSSRTGENLEQQGSSSATSATSSSSSSGTREAKTRGRRAGKVGKEKEILNLADQIMGDGKGDGGEARLPQDPELDAEALQKRQNKIDKVKAWPSYQQYLANVPKDARTKDQPSTPSCTESARLFRYEMEKFRRWLADNYAEEEQ